MSRYEILVQLELDQVVFAYFQCDYVLKVDDDSFVRLNILYDDLTEKHVAMARNELINIPLYWGFFNGHAQIKSKGQWKESNWFLCDRYLPYAQGGGYLVSKWVVNFVANCGTQLQSYNSEDVSLGTWLAPFKLHRVHDIRFDTEYQSRGCVDAYVIQHKQAPVDIKQKFDNLVLFDKLCSNGEWEHKLAYHYNWNVPPSRCCVRNVSMAN